MFSPSCTIIQGWSLSLFFLQKPHAGGSFFSLYDCSLLVHWRSLLSSFYLPYLCVCVCVCIHIRINFWLRCFDPPILDPACLSTSCQLWDGVVQDRRAQNEKPGSCARQTWVLHPRLAFYQSTSLEPCFIKIKALVQIKCEVNEAVIIYQFSISPRPSVSQPQISI